MMRGSFFKKLLLYLLCACLLTAVLTGLLYGFSSVHVLSDRVADDLLSRAVSLSYLCSKQMNREILFDSFYAFMASELRGARVYIYDAQGAPLLWSKEDTGDAPGAAHQKILDGVVHHVPHVKHPGDVRRGNDDGVGFTRRVDFRVEVTALHPVIVPFVLQVFRVVLRRYVHVFSGLFALCRCEN